jgi:HAD superfamily hydrolase (TIGR01509 family)
MTEKLRALIFDCDGVLAETERDGHRVAFNETFARMGYGLEWDVALYKELVKIGGGKERMKYFFESTSWPAGTSDRDALIRELHKLKTDRYTHIIESGRLPLRPGVARIVDEAVAAGVKLAVCSTSNEKSVHTLVEKLLGPARKAEFDVILAGDVVSKKKPDPEIYRLALARLNVKPTQGVVVEDNRNGLLAAKGAGLYCVVTTNAYTQDEDFSEADLVVPELGDPPHVHVDLATLRRIVEECG